MRDVAALNTMEMLPWDVWGAIPYPNELLNDDRLGFFDQLAMLTRSLDSSFAEMRTLYEGDDCLSVPDIVFNSVPNYSETI